jgi:hypothetical protein
VVLASDNLTYLPTPQLTTREQPFHTEHLSASYISRPYTWEGRNPGSIGILLSSPRWEGRLLRYLELSGVGRFVEGGIEEDEAHAARMDRWIVWEAEEERVRQSPIP